MAKQTFDEANEVFVDDKYDEAHEVGRLRREDVFSREKRNNHLLVP